MSAKYYGSPRRYVTTVRVVSEVDVETVTDDFDKAEDDAIERIVNSRDPETIVSMEVVKQSSRGLEPGEEYDVVVPDTDDDEVLGEVFLWSSVWTDDDWITFGDPEFPDFSWDDPDPLYNVDCGDCGCDEC